MKKFAKLLALLLAVLFVFSACQTTPGNENGTGDGNDSDQTTEKTKVTTSDPGQNTPLAEGEGTVLNADSDYLYYFSRYFNNDLSNLSAKIPQYFNEHWKDQGLSDLLFNVDGNIPSEKYEYKGEHYTRTVEDGQAVDYTGNNGGKVNEGYKVVYDIYEVAAMDPLKTWIGMCNENGIHPWLSFRMNDVHYANEKLGHSYFFYEAKNNGWMIGANTTRWRDNNYAGSTAWYPYCLDYTYEEVRDHFAGYIDEVLSKYDCYGIELDWQRCIWCFPADLASNCQYMNLFMEQINGIVSKYETQYGHEIKIMARIDRDIDNNKLFGFDVLHWAEQDWIDVVVPASYWGCTDSMMPIRKWKEELADYDVKVYAGLEYQTVAQQYSQTLYSLAGYAATYFNAGADKIYLYNAMVADPMQWKICRSLDAAMKAAKRCYLVSRSNAAPQGKSNYLPLPITLSNGQDGSVQLQHGKLNLKQAIVINVVVKNVSVGTKTMNDRFTVTYNGLACECIGPVTNSYFNQAEFSGCVFSFRVPTNGLEEADIGTIAFHALSDVTIQQVELVNGNTRL